MVLKFEIGMLGAKPSKTPMEVNQIYVAYDDYAKKNSNDDKLLSDATVYRKFIDKLIYLTITRPDILFMLFKG